MSEGWTEITTRWENQKAFIGQNAAGGTVQMGNLDDKPGVGPMQMLLIGLAGCTGMDIVSILQKKQINLSDMQIKVRGKRAREYPMIWTDIHVTYLLWGDAIPSKDAEQAIRLSEEKYCSVELMLSKSARISSEFKIFKPGQSAE